MTLLTSRQRLLTLVVALMIPIAVIVTTWSGLHRHLLAEELEELEQEQTAWLEENKQLLASIAIHRSPRRIAELAERILGLVLINFSEVSYIDMPTSISIEKDRAVPR